MEMTGEQRVAAGRDEVWAALNDPAVLKACIPGCESIDKQSDSDYKIVMLAAVGPIKARFNGKLSIQDADPPKGYALVFEGSGGAAGFGKGQASVALAEEAAGVTILSYKASAQVSGKLAQVGSRLIDGVAKKLAGDFFARLDACFTQAPADEAVAADTAAPPETAPASSSAAAPAPARETAAPGVAAPAASHATGWKIATFTFAAIAAAALAYAFSVA